MIDISQLKFALDSVANSAANSVSKAQVPQLAGKESKQKGREKEQPEEEIKFMATPITKEIGEVEFSTKIK